MDLCFGSVSSLTLDGILDLYSDFLFRLLLFLLLLEEGNDTAYYGSNSVHVGAGTGVERFCFAEALVDAALLASQNDFVAQDGLFKIILIVGDFVAMREERLHEG